ncbi:Unknown protein sequence [Pseudomonas coronafaciens pv. oryzae]|nr:Unknown protein sequence [Pseudomonas coronafaciens pv. oryzae]
MLAQMSWSLTGAPIPDDQHFAAANRGLKARTAGGSAGVKEFLTVGML